MEVPPVVPAKRTSSPIDQVWDFFVSVKLAIFTLIILAIASIFGTIVEQNQPPEKYHQIYEDWAFALMNRINLFDMYHSWWFLAPAGPIHGEPHLLHDRSLPEDA